MRDRGVVEGATSGDRAFLSQIYKTKGVCVLYCGPHWIGVARGRGDG